MVRDGAKGTRAGGGLWARVGLVWRVAWPYLMSKGCPEYLLGVKMSGVLSYLTFTSRKIFCTGYQVLWYSALTSCFKELFHIWINHIEMLLLVKFTPFPLLSIFE